MFKTTSGSFPRTDISNNITFSLSESHVTVPLKYQKGDFSLYLNLPNHSSFLIYQSHETIAVKRQKNQRCIMLNFAVECLQTYLDFREDLC
jgi:hypothetical protein